MHTRNWKETEGGGIVTNLRRKKGMTTIDEGAG